MSQPWRETKDARSWMLEQELDPLFEVRRMRISLVHQVLITPLGLRLEPQDTRLVTAARSG